MISKGNINFVNWCIFDYDAYIDHNIRMTVTYDTSKWPHMTKLFIWVSFSQ